MKRLLALIGLIGLASPARAETWWLVVAADSRRSNDGPLFYQIPIGSEQDCELAGSKLVASAKDGSFDKANVDKLGFECIKGK